MLKINELFWEILGGSGGVLGGFGRFWEVCEVVRGSWRYLEVLGGPGRFWEILGDSGRFLEILVDSGKFLETLRDSGEQVKSYLDRNVSTHLIHGNFLWTHAQNLKCCLSEYIPNYQWRVEVGLHCPDQVLFLHNSKDYQ